MKRRRGYEICDDAEPETKRARPTLVESCSANDDAMEIDDQLQHDSIQPNTTTHLPSLAERNLQLNNYKRGREVDEDDDESFASTKRPMKTLSVSRVGGITTRLAGENF